MEPNFSLNRSDNVFCNVSTQTATNSYLLCAFVGCLSVLVTCGNFLVIISIMYFKQLHTPTNYLILSLAVADLLVGVIVLPFSAVLSVSSCWYLSGLLCKIRGAFDVFLCTSSILNLCFISADRYYIVFQPLMYRTKMTARVAGLMILVSWALPVMFGLMITFSGPSMGVPSDSRCNMFQSSKTAVFGVIFTSFLPAIVIFSLYMRILTVAHRQARSLQSNTKSGASVSKMESKATKTLAIVVGIYLFCWSPYFLSICFYPLRSNFSPVPLIEAFKWLGWSNSMFNPFVYGFFYKWFRSAFKLIISGKIFQEDCSNSKLS